MHIERFGRGPRVFFGLHGWSGNLDTFAPLLADLPPDVSFYSADLPGCGASPAPSQWSVEAVISEVSQAIMQLAQPVTLVGNCSGANLAFFVAQRIPLRVQRMVAIDAFAFWPWYFRVFVNPIFGRYAYATTFANPVGRWLTNLSLRGRREKQTSLTRGFAAVDHHATYRYLSMLRYGGDIEQFRGLAIPVDLCYGDKTFQGVKDSARIFCELWPRARVTSLPGAGHLPILEATSALRELIFARDLKESLCIAQTTTCPF